MKIQSPHFIGLCLALLSLPAGTYAQDTTPPHLVSASGDASFARVIVHFDEPVDPASATAPFNYSVGGGLEIVGIAMGPDGRSVILSTSPQAQDTSYTVTVSGVEDLATAPNTIADDSTIQFHSFVFSCGFVSFETYNTGPGNAVSNLTSHPLFPNSPRPPSFLPVFDTRTVFPDDSQDDYGARITSLFMPRVSGNYIFHLKSAAGSELWFNPAGPDADGAILIQAETACCGQFSDHASPPQSLNAGQRYFIMALYKAGNGADYCQVAVKLETDPTDPDALQPIDGGSLGLFADPTCAQITVSRQPTNITATTGCLSACFNVAAAGTTCIGTNAPVAFQWQRNGGAGFTDVPGANSAAFCASVALADNGAQFRVIICIPGATAISQTAIVTVVSDTTPPTLVSAIANCASNKISVTFSECLDANTAADPVNYQVSGGVNIQSAVLAPDGRTVCLIIDALTAGVSYTLTAGDVQDLSGNAVAPGSGITFSCGTAPTILQQPQDLIVVAGEDALFNVMASGSAPITMTLVKTNLPGLSLALSTNGTLVLSSVLPSDAWGYQVKASNAYGTAISRVASLRVEARTNFLARLDSAGALKLIGTAADEDIEVRRSTNDPTRLEVDDLRTPGTDFSFPVAGITAIIVDLGEGHDRILFITDPALVGLPTPIVVQTETEVSWQQFGIKWYTWEMTCPNDISVPCKVSGNNYSLGGPTAYFNDWTGRHAVSSFCHPHSFSVGTTPVCCDAYYSDGFSTHHHSCCFNVTVTDIVQGPMWTATPGPSYSADFNSGWPPGLNHYGNAIAQSGALKLTRNVNNQYGVAVVPQFNTVNLIQSFRATFKLYIGGGNTCCADGFSFNLSDNIPAAFPYSHYEEGLGTGLTVEFDTFSNGGNDPVGIFIKDNGSPASSGTIIPPTGLSQGPSVTSPGWIPVEITMDFCGHVKVFYNDILYAVGEINYVPGAAARFVLAARTGALNDNHWVDDLVITTESGGQDITVNAPANQCCKDVTYVTPSFTDSDCNRHITVLCTPPSGHCFPLGINRVCCIASDLSAVKGRFGFEVIVKDVTPPVINCSQVPNLEMIGCIGFVPDYRPYIIFADNCGPLILTNGTQLTGMTLTQIPAPGSAVLSGPTLVTLTVCDPSGNCSSCTTTFTVTPPLKPIPGLFSTGVDNNNALLVAGTPDPHCSGTVGVGGSAFAPLVIDPARLGWLPNGPDSQWIGPTATGGGITAPLHVYRFSFYLACKDDVQIVGKWAASSSGELWLNGVQQTAFASTGPASWTPFTLTSGFSLGLNLLEFRVPIKQIVNENGLRVQFTSPLYGCCACGLEPPTGLVLWTPFDELDTGSVAHNVAGGNNGHYYGPPIVDPSYGYVDRSRCFNGVDQYVSVPYYSAIDITTGEFSIDAWVKRDANDSGTRQIVNHRSDPGLPGYAFYLINGVLIFEMRDAGAGNVFAIGQLVPADGNWHFVGVTVKRNDPLGGTLSMDTDPRISFDTSPANGSLANGADVLVGAGNVGSGGLQEFFKGCIDEVEIFNRQLSQAEVDGIRLSGPQGKCKLSANLPNLSFCPGDQTITVTAPIWNYSAYPETYFYAVAGLLPGYPLTGPLTLGGLPATTATVPPWTCTTISFTMARPTGLGGIHWGCIKLLVLANNSGTMTMRQATVIGLSHLVCQPSTVDPWITNLALATPITVDRGRFRFGPITLANPFDSTVVLAYRVVVVKPDLTPDTTVISLNGLPPGALITNSIVLGPGESSTLEINGQFLMDDPGQTYNVLIEGDVDGSGMWAPLGSFAVSEFFQSTLEITYEEVDGILKPAVSWSSFGTLQCSPGLGGPWTDLAAAANPYLIPAGGGNVRFYRLKQ